ncbi:MAG: hypothetical protein E7341_03610 [Clostridiales bacterium]|nr:hypothetical protein [Clostridiales bacterium]
MNKKIFEVFDAEEIIVIFNKNEISELVNILKENNIRCNAEDFESYLWVRFDKNSTLAFSNFGPINERCRAYDFKTFKEKIKV